MQYTLRNVIWVKSGYTIIKAVPLVLNLCDSPSAVNKSLVREVTCNVIIVGTSFTIPSIFISIEFASIIPIIVLPFFHSPLIFFSDPVDVPVGEGVGVPVGEGVGEGVGVPVGEGVGVGEGEGVGVPVSITFGEDLYHITPIVIMTAIITRADIAIITNTSGFGFITLR